MTGTLLAGAMLGRYRIVRLLGSGAMGDVYLAEDPHIERQLAIKTVRVAEGKPEDVEDRKRRLLREAKAAGRMIHPHVVTLFDAGEAEGVLYLAFEFVGGSDLAHRIQAPPPLTLGEVLRIVRETADALDFAHRQGIVHRDIKPANIMLDAHGRVKVADFGIAKVVGQATELTMTGSVVGSPHYLSPEQVRGEELDGRTDVFSLGVVLYELLGHRRPFQGESLTTLVYQILHQEPPPIPQLRAELAPHLDGLVRRMMAKDREQRFANAGALAAEIAALERDLGPERLAQPVVAPDPETQGTRMMTASGPSPVVAPSPSLSSSPTSFAPPPLQPQTASAAPMPFAAVAAQAPPAPAKRSALPIVLALVGVFVVGGAIGLYLLLGKLVFKPKPPEIGKKDAQTATVEPAPQRPPQANPAPQPPITPSVAEDKPAAPEPTPPKPVVVAPEPTPTKPAPPPAPEPKAQEPVPQRPPVQRPAQVEPAPPPVQPVAPPEPEPEPEPVPLPSFDKEITTGLSIAFQIVPDTALIRYKEVGDARWTVLGQAKEWSGKKDMRKWNPEPGDYLVGILAEKTVTYLIHAQPGGPSTPIVLNLAPPKKR